MNEASSPAAESPPTVSDWVMRCAVARANGQPIPSAQLFRRMLEHEEYFAIGGEVLGGPGTAVDVFLSADVADALAAGADGLHQFGGLQLTAAIESGTSELRLFFAADDAPLVLDEVEVDAFRAFLQVTVVESVLMRMQSGDELLVEQPFARLRAFDGFLTVCAGGQSQPGESPAPLKMALAEDAGGEGRRLAAVFTAEDALQYFIAHSSRSASDGLVSVRLSGRELCEQVAGNTEIDGFVFNPCGPSAPVALAREAANDILAGE